MSGKFDAQKTSGVQMEFLDRGLVAAAITEGIFLSWRLLGNEVTGYSGNGMIGTNFNLYRSGDLIATVHDSTNYLDPSGTLTSVYYVCAVVDGQEVDRCADVTPGRVHTMNYLCENRLTVSRQLAKSIHTRQMI